MIAGSAILLVGVAPASASAFGDSLQNGSGELCLHSTVAGTVSGASCAGTASTLEWQAPHVSGGVGTSDEVFQLQNVLTGQCLGATAAGAVSTAACGTSAAQHWTTDGGDVLINMATGGCLTGENPEASSEAVRMTTCGNIDNPPDGQEWFWGDWV